jgi:hypothetical protein
MLQRPEPLEALQLDDTSAGIQLVSVARPTTDWPVQLLSLTGFKRLTMWNSHGRYYHFSETPPSGSQLSAVLTHIALGQTDLGLGPGGTGLSDWLDVIKRLPALEVFEAPKDEVLTLGLFRVSATAMCPATKVPCFVRCSSHASYAAHGWLHQIGHPCHVGAGAMMFRTSCRQSWCDSHFVMRLHPCARVCAGFPHSAPTPARPAPSQRGDFSRREPQGAPLTSLA